MAQDLRHPQGPKPSRGWQLFGRCDGAGQDRSAAISPRADSAGHRDHAAALSQPTTVEEITALPASGQQTEAQRHGVADAHSDARSCSTLRHHRTAGWALLPPVCWARRNPEAAARLGVARTALGGLSARVGVGGEPGLDLVRRLCWDWQPASDVGAAVADFLREGGARNWQQECRAGAGRGAEPGSAGRQPAAEPVDALADRFVDALRGHPPGDLTAMLRSVRPTSASTSLREEWSRNC